VKRSADAIDGSEGDEAVARTDVGDRHPGSESRAFKNTISEAINSRADNALEIGIIGVAAVEKPLGPQITLGINLAEAYRLTGTSWMRSGHSVRMFSGVEHLELRWIGAPSKERKG
jgi:hypothetical protein